MNRVAFWPASQTTSQEDSQPLDLSTPFDTRDPAKAVFVPLRYQATHAYPLLVWLHDEGECESAMRRMIPRASLRNFVAVGVRGTTALGETNAYRWDQTSEGIHAATAAVMSCISGDEVAIPHRTRPCFHCRIGRRWHHGAAHWP